MRSLGKLILVLSVVGCSIEPQPISYGKDACNFCKMNIVDQQHASELVTKKGKVFKYDAIECMLKDSDNNSDENISMFLVCDYLKPGEFIDATKASYLISESIPSPMGEYLSAFESEKNAIEHVKSDNDQVLTWLQVKKEIN